MAPNDLDRPAAGWFIVLDGGIVALAAMALSGRAYGAVRSRIPVPSRSALRRMLAATVLIHVGESAYAGVGARKRGLSPGPWMLQSAIVGFPSLRLLRRRTA